MAGAQFNKLRTGQLLMSVGTLNKVGVVLYLGLSKLSHIYYVDVFIIT